MQTYPLAIRILAKIMRFAFRLLYYEFSWTYDVVAWAVSLGRWNDWIRTVIPYLQGPLILELGHGPGHLQKALLTQPGTSIIGLDLSPYMGRQALRRLRRQKLMPALINSDSRKLPFSGDTFSSIAATFPTEYIFSEATLCELYRVIIPGGRLVIAPLAWITGKGAADRLAARLFQVTGQAPEWQETALLPFRNAGFHVTTEWVEVRKSTVLIIVAEKFGPLGFGETHPNHDE